MLPRDQASGTSSVQTEAVPVLGVPHHMAVFYTVECLAPGRRSRRRLKRCATYEWNGIASASDKARLCCAADCAAPKWTKSESERSAEGLKSAIANWHARAEAVLREAVKLELAVAVKESRKAKRVGACLQTNCQCERLPATTVNQGQET